MNLNSFFTKQSIKNVLLTAVGTMILAFGTAVFLLPFSLVTGGVSGIAIILERLNPYEFITLDMIVAALTWTLFALGRIFLGRTFAVKTLISSLLYPLFISLFIRLFAVESIGGYFSFEGSALGESVIIVAAIFGGVFVGLGCAVTFLGGGSTGGVDIIAFLICKINRRIKSSYAIFAVDAVVILLGAFAIGDLAVTLLGVASALVAAVLVDKVFLGGEGAFAANIVTEKADEIVELIISELDRTATVMEAVGGYSKKRKQVVFVSFNLREYPKLLSIISEADKYAFVTFSRVHEINGEGWTR